MTSQPSRSGIPVAPAAFARAALLAAAAVVLTAGGAAAAEKADAAAAYPASTAVRGLTLDYATARTLARRSDNWANTWAADGRVLSVFGDGPGFAAAGRLSLGVAELTGSTAATVSGRNLAVPRAAAGRGARGPAGPVNGKSYSILALDRSLYMFVSPGSGRANYKEARLYKGPLSGQGPWQRAQWAFTAAGPDRLLQPGFLQAGRGQADLGEHVYAYASRYAPVGGGAAAPSGKKGAAKARSGGGLNIQRGPQGGEVALLRASRRSDLLRRESWEFYAGLDARGAPRWTRNPSEIAAVIRDRAGVGWTTSATYNKALDRYLVATEYGRHAASRLNLLEGTTAWGPWRTVARTTVRGPERKGFYYSALANSFSPDGRRFTLVYSGRGQDALNVVDARLGGGSAAAPAGRAANGKVAQGRRAAAGTTAAAAKAKAAATTEAKAAAAAAGTKAQAKAARAATATRTAQAAAPTASAKASRAAATAASAKAAAGASRAAAASAKSGGGRAVAAAGKQGGNRGQAAGRSERGRDRADRGGRGRGR